jgi:hypothetical protein
MRQYVIPKNHSIPCALCDSSREDLEITLATVKQARVRKLESR